jgi:hypothetical protein
MLGMMLGHGHQSGDRSDTARSMGRRILVAATLATLATSPAEAASFLGLDTATGDEIDSIGFVIDPNSGTYFESSGQLDFTAKATNIDAHATIPVDTLPTTRHEISGSPGGGTNGAVDVNVDVDSETLSWAGAGAGGSNWFNYQATLEGRASDIDITLTSAVGGALPEQDGRTLITGEILGLMTIDVFFNDVTGLFGTLDVTGTFQVTGGDPVFMSIFGNAGDLAKLFTDLISSIPDTSTLLADGHLFSTRDDGSEGSLLAACAAGVTCTGSVVGTQDFTFGGQGEIIPDSPSAFVPEPGTGLLLGLGLCGFAGLRRPRQD